MDERYVDANELHEIIIRQLAGQDRLSWSYRCTVHKDRYFLPEWSDITPIFERYAAVRPEYGRFNYNCVEFAVGLQALVSFQAWDAFGERRPPIAFATVAGREPCRGEGHAMNLFVDTERRLWVVEPQVVGQSALRGFWPVEEAPLTQIHVVTVL